MHNILEVISEEEKSSAKTISSIIEINGWMKSSDKNTLSQALKNHELELFIRVRKAKGISNSSTFIIIYLKEYVNNRLTKLKDIMLLKIPSKENTLILAESIVITEFKPSTNAEKEISLFRIEPPICIISEESKSVKYIKNSHIK